MIVDANLLVYACDVTSPVGERAREWLESAVGGRQRVGLPWASLTAFLRLTTNPRVMRSPLDPATAWRQVDEWLAQPTVWIPAPTRRHADVLGDLIVTYRLTGKIVMDADLAALAIQHGLPVYSADSDFARFSEIEWVNPVARGAKNKNL